MKSYRDREEEVYKNFLARAKDEFASLVTPDLIAEHKADPLGAKSHALLHLLNFMRQSPLDGKLAVYAIEPGKSYQIIALSDTPDKPIDTSDVARFATEEEALHEVFLRRLDELGLYDHEPVVKGAPSWPDVSKNFVIGYTDRLDARPGESLSVHLSSDREVEVSVELVALGKGEVTGDVREHTVKDLGTVRVYPKFTDIGSYAYVPALSNINQQAESFGVTFMPTSAGRDLRQVIAGQFNAVSGWAITIKENQIEILRYSDGKWSTIMANNQHVVEQCWYVVVLTRTEQGTELALENVASRSSKKSMGSNGLSELVCSTEQLEFLDSTLYIAGLGNRSSLESLDGKIEAPFFAAGRDTVSLALERKMHNPLQKTDGVFVYWSPAAALQSGRLLSQDIPAFVLGSTGWERNENLDAKCVNTPTWAVTSSAWDGREERFLNAPDQWDAVHFHRSDLDDADWAKDLDLDLPENMESGAYAVRLLSENSETERLPFFVEPRSAQNPVAVIIPTASYLAYANDHPGTQAQMAQATASRTPVLLDGDLFMHDHPELGRSMYDVHLDGSGVGYATLRRPLLNMRPTHRYHVGAWQLPADLHLLSWLEDEGIDFDVITDHSLHRRGVSLLQEYPVILTASHSEYYSTEMLDAVEEYIADGGRFMYLGANGFYWRVAFDPDRPWVMELRRGENGSRGWQSEPGQLFHAFTGEKGGLWRNLGRPPQRTFGVGFSSQGFDTSGWYRRLEDSYDPRAGFIFEGMEQETFGHNGHQGGAAGQETDRYDRQLGTPSDALLLATSEGLSEGYLRTVEEIFFLVAGTSATVDHQVRADMTYFVNQAGGAVFSTGSIAWSLALGEDEGVSMITRNVIKRFADPEELDW